MIKNYLHKVNNYVEANGKKSVRFLAKQLGYSKSAIHRHQNKLERRSSILGSEFFETENGQNWIFQFIIASILVFGIICGVGSDRIALFMSLLG